ncbi:MAG: M56 family metallopeptidase [Alistipes sp.]|nr:M56 family metallopeptidase [Alistipes sp.]
MFDFLIYLAQSSLCLAALYLIYKVAMSHETLHVFNRVILLGSVILSALLPLCRVKVVKEYDAAPTVASIEVDDMVLVENVPELGIDFVSLFKDIAVAAFVIGVAFMLVRLAVGIYSVWRLIHSGRVSVITDDVTLTVVSKLSTPFSWFGHIVASEEDMKVYRDMILSHELAHIRLRHSWDVMFVDLALCLWWFNPAMWLLRRELQSLHEYQADDAVLNEGVDAKNYQMLLIKRAAGARLHSVANCLNHSNLKNRITMMCKKNSSRWAAAKALLVLPVVAISLSAFATTVYVPREVQDKVTENSVNEQISQTESNASAMQESQQDDRPFIKVEKMPTFDGGKSLVGFQNWIQNNIRYPKEALAKGVGGRVIFQFVVERDGTPSSFNVLKSPDKSLADEVERVFKTSPKWEAGEQGGKKVRVLYTVPVVFTTPSAETQEFEQQKQNFEAQKQNFEQQKDLAYIKVEKMPTFQGGDLNAFRNWVQGQIQYPKEAMEKNISGRVIFSFVVEKDGSTSDFTVLQAPDKLLVAEVERIFKTCPKWEAGTQRGEKVRVKYTVPIVFAIQGNNAANEGLKVVGVKSQPKTAESEAAIAEFKKTADIVIKSENGKEIYFVNGKEVKKEDVGAYEPEKVVVDGAHSDGVKTVYIKVKK